MHLIWVYFLEVRIPFFPGTWRVKWSSSIMCLFYATRATHTDFVLDLFISPKKKYEWGGGGWHFFGDGNGQPLGDFPDFIHLTLWWFVTVYEWTGSSFFKGKSPTKRAIETTTMSQIPRGKLKPQYSHSDAVGSEISPCHALQETGARLCVTLW